MIPAASTVQLPILLDIAIVFGFAIFVIFICRLLKIPYIIGYLITGILVGPNALNVVNNTGEVNAFAEIGVVLLLFAVGLEFSFKSLMKIKNYVLLGGFLQVFGTILISTLLIVLMGREWSESIFWGFVIALSSTAIVVKRLQDQLMINKEHGKMSLAILLFQDIVVVPLVLLVPILAGQSGNVAADIGILILKLALIAGVGILLARYVIPQFLYQVMKIQSQEIFLIATLLIVLLITLTTQYLGLSLALGAFIAGLIIAETDYNHLAISCIVPFKYVFITFFFISMGMLLDVSIFARQGALITFWFVFILLVKFAAATLASKALGLNIKNALMAGFTLSQIGEFSFILAKEGLNYALISETNYQIFLAVSILTMLLTPYLIDYSERISGIFIVQKAAENG